MFRFMSFMIAAVLLTSTGCSKAIDVKRNHDMSEGIKYSYAIPDGWKQIVVPGITARAIAGPLADGFTPNINVVVEKSDVKTLEGYKNESVPQLKKLMKLVVVKQNDFKTESGLAGLYLIGETEFNDFKLRQTIYFFQTEDEKVRLVMTCTTLREGGEKLDALFELAAKSFRIE